MKELVQVMKKMPFKSVEHIREWIDVVEKHFAKEEQIEQDIRHHHSHGVYAREMRLKKDQLVVGKIHRHENLNIISKGSVTVLSIDGLHTFHAPCTFVGSSGAKRIIYAHKDTVWTVIHGTKERDLEKIENEMIAKSYDELPRGSACLGS